MPRSAVVISGARRRGHVTGTDLLERLGGGVPIDLFGIDAAAPGDIGDLPWARLHEQSGVAWVPTLMMRAPERPGCRREHGMWGRLAALLGRLRPAPATRRCGDWFREDEGTAGVRVPPRPRPPRPGGAVALELPADEV